MQSQLALMNADLQDVLARLDHMSDTDATPHSAVDTERDSMSTVVRFRPPGYQKFYFINII